MSTRIEYPMRLAEEQRHKIQGIVASAYGHLPWTAYLFVRFHERDGARRWLAGETASLSDACDWRRGPNATRRRPPGAASLALTMPGLEALGLPRQSLDSFPQPMREGMHHPRRSQVLGDLADNAPCGWEFGGSDSELPHAMMLLYADCAEALGQSVEGCVSRMGGFGAAVEERTELRQSGFNRPDAAEPFGFRDGISQPRILGFHGEGVRTGEFVMGYPNEYGYMPVSPVVAAEDDPQRLLTPSANPEHKRHGLRDLGGNGSYLVYRKLEQDVGAFWRSMVDAAGDTRRAVELAARLVGRWPDGSALSLASRAARPELAIVNDFGFAGDGIGRLCPLGSHIRRMNPRDHLRPHGPEASTRMTNRHRLLRRGRAWGRPVAGIEALRDPAAVASGAAVEAILRAADHDGPRGLHFVALCANITSQFEFVQQAWGRNPRMQGLASGPDPFVGATPPAAEPSSEVRVPMPDGREIAVQAAPFVRVRAGFYAFLPGLAALRFLAGGD